MKALLIGLALVGTLTVHAQGTIQFLNSTLSRLQYWESVGGPINTALPVGTHIGAFWGPDSAGAASVVGMGRGYLAGPTALTTAGGLWFGATVYPVNGTQEGQRVWLKIAGWIGGDAQSPTGSIVAYGESAVVSVVLGPTAGPGNVVWQNAAGTHTERAKPFIIGVPEPSVWVIGILGLVGLLALGRRHNSE